MRDCPSSRIFAACRDFISVTTDVPFRWDERWAWFRCAFIIPLEDEHVHALRSGERGCFLVVQTLWAEKIQSTTVAGSLNAFDRNEIEVAPISSALLRIACLVILYKTLPCSGPRTRSRWDIRTDTRTRAQHRFSPEGVQPVIRPIPGTNSSWRSSSSRLTVSTLFSHEL